MQTGLYRFVKQVRAESLGCGDPFFGSGGVYFPLGSLNRVALTDLQERLTVTPRAVFDRSRTPEQIVCFRLNETHIIVPRAFGYKRAFLATGRSVRDCSTVGEPLSDEALFAGTLQEEQLEAQTATLNQLRSPPNCCILTLPCGFGKTVVALSIATQLKRRTLVVVHKEFLLAQWKERIEHFIPKAKVGLLQGSKVVAANADIILGMLQTLCTRLSDSNSEAAKAVQQCGLVVIDEAHHMAARWFSELFFHLPCRHILGLTATPNRKDGCTPMLHMFMGDYSFVREQRLQAEVMKVRKIPYDSKGKVLRELSSTETQRLKTALTRDATRTALIVGLCCDCIDEGRHVLCLSDRLMHLKTMLAAFQVKMPTVTAALYVGGQKRAEREAAEKHAQMLFGTFAMAQEGLDVPRLDTLVLASPISDLTQSVGRILRPCTSKMTPLVLDVQDNLCANFTRQNEQRARLYARLGFTVETEAELQDSRLAKLSSHMPTGLKRSLVSISDE